MFRRVRGVMSLLKRRFKSGPLQVVQGKDHQGEGGCRDCSAEGSQCCSRNSEGEAKAEGPGPAQADDPAAPGVHGLCERQGLQQGALQVPARGAESKAQPEWGGSSSQEEAGG